MLPKINKNDKVLILGAKGNLGRQIMRYFGNEYRLYCWDMEDIDLMNQRELIEKILPIKPNYIINCAAYNAVDRCETDKNEEAKAMRLNGWAVGELADIAMNLDAALIHFVSDYVFDGSKKEGYTEVDNTKPVSVYGKSKALGEKELFKREKQGLKYYLIRTSRLFGPKGESNNAKESFFDMILRLSTEDKELSMVHNEEISCFTYTKDLAQEVLKLVDNKKPYGVYHIVNEGPASWYDAAKYLLKIKRIKDVKLIPVKTKDYPRPAKRPMYSVLLNTKLPKLRSWKKALKEYLDNQ